MGNVFTLDSVREEVEKEFAPVTVDMAEGSVVLRNVLRVPKLRRDKVFKLIDELEAATKDEDGNEIAVEALGMEHMEKTAGIAVELIRLVSDSDKLGEILCTALEDDVALTLAVFGKWMEVTQPGGSRTLAELVDDYGDMIFADLWSEYGVDLRDIFVPESRLTPRCVLILIKELPIASRFFAEKQGGPQFRGWDESRYTMVAIVNAVRALQYTYVAAHSKSRPKAPAPYPIPKKKTNSLQQQLAKPGSFAYIVAAQMRAARKRRAEQSQEPVAPK
ncbi:tail assembly chaperone [Mycobacterium phage Yecey3]|uniref:Tail assembly chaperone n=1 Tax=Mycobacterium phage Yecey3 TaxID=2656617 RepID=A0A649V8W9_9CAUD|nr:tail assembly chaperone [Mycobacterium phage Yecey3]QGJ88777.1 tail assembly chaperone [Mycobacterium phage Yecey3]